MVPTQKLFKLHKGFLFSWKTTSQILPNTQMGPFKNGKVRFKSPHTISWEDIAPWPASLLISLFLFQLHPWMTWHLSKLQTGRHFNLIFSCSHPNSTPQLSQLDPPASEQGSKAKPADSWLSHLSTITQVPLPSLCPPLWLNPVDSSRT